MSDKKKAEQAREQEAKEAQADSLQDAAEQAENAVGTEQNFPEEAPAKSEAELLMEQIAELNDRLLRTTAEYDNFRRRSQREKEAIYPQATAAAVGNFVPILDTFDRALAAPCTDESFKQGVEMILTNFKGVLTKLGVEEFAAAGEAFNPEMHNAVMHVEDDSMDAGMIVEVFQKGYKIGDRIVRHAMVKVAN